MNTEGVGEWCQEHRAGVGQADRGHCTTAPWRWQGQVVALNCQRQGGCCYNDRVAGTARLARTQAPLEMKYMRCSRTREENSNLNHRNSLLQQPPLNSQTAAQNPLTMGWWSRLREKSGTLPGSSLRGTHHGVLPE